MDDSEKPVRQPEPAAECPAASTLRDSYYRPLVRLAALLTGDAESAEAVACEALAGLRSRSPRCPQASPEELQYLQQRVLVSSRRIRGPLAPAEIRHARTGPRAPFPSRAHSSAGPAQPGAADFARLPVVRALQELPRRGREAVVLTLYLDLSEQQAALVAGVTPTALRRFLREAMRALDAQFPAA